MTFGEEENTLELLSLQKRKFRGDTVTVFKYVLLSAKDEKSTLLSLVNRAGNSGLNCRKEETD